MEYDLELACQRHWRAAGLDQFEPPVLKDIDPVLGRLELFIRDIPAIRHVNFRGFCSEALRLPDIKQIRSITLGNFSSDGKSIEAAEPSTDELDDMVDLLWPYWEGGDFTVQRSDTTDHIAFWFYGLSIIQGAGWDKLMKFMHDRFNFSAWIIIDVDILSLEKMF